MVKAPVKRKQKQKIKQKVKVSQNVKVVIGDIKKKKAPRRAGAKAGPVKPSTTINITNPQASNPYINFFKDQITKAVKEATTMNQKNEQIEREETKASKLNLLGKLQQEPDDTARQMRADAAETRARIQQAQAERDKQLRDAMSSLKVVSERKAPKETGRANLSIQPQMTPSIRFKEEEGNDEAEMMREMEAQRERTQQAINKGGAGADDDDDEDEEEEEEEEAKTEVGTWNPSEEQKLGEYDALYRRPESEIRKAFTGKDKKQLIKIAQQTQVPYNRGGKQLNKDEIELNLIKHFATGAPQPRPGKPKKQYHTK